MGAPAPALAALEVAVAWSTRERSPGASLSGFMARHIEQPGSRQSKPASVKTVSRPSASAWLLHRAASRARPGCACPSATWRPFGHGGDGPQVLDAAVGARADEDGVDRRRRDRRAGGEAHVLEGPLGGVALGRVGEVVGVGDAPAIGTTWPGLVPQRDVRRRSRRRRGRPPCRRWRPRRWRACASRRRPRPTASPVGACGAALEVVEGRLVGGDEPGLGAGLDRHVADRHAALHRQRPDGRAAVLGDVADAAAGADARRGWPG